VKPRTRGRGMEECGRQGVARKGTSRPGRARLGLDRLGPAGQGWHGPAMRCTARHCGLWPCNAGRCLVRQGWRGMAAQISLRCCKAELVAARSGSAWLARLGCSRHVRVRRSRALLGVAGPGKAGQAMLSFGRCGVAERSEAGGAGRIWSRLRLARLGLAGLACRGIAGRCPTLKGSARQGWRG
jgi:hypothetical protein